jgi:tRNA dimethylallyltransferase
LQSTPLDSDVLAIVGPTAVGKTVLSLEVAKIAGAEVVSIDSGQIYRGMDIGTAKPSRSDLAEVPHHMIDVFDPSRSVSVAEFRELARAAIDDIRERGKTPLLVGGSGLYFRAVVDPLEFPGTDADLRARVQKDMEEEGPEGLHSRLRVLDPEAAERIDPKNIRRTVRALEVIELTGRRFSEFRVAWDDYESIYSIRVAGLTLPKEELNQRIDQRVDELIAGGLLDEVRTLEKRGLRRSITAVQALGYAQLIDYLDGNCSLEEAVDRIKRGTRRFARRQLSWFKADPRVHWFKADSDDAKKFLLERTKEGLRGQ